MTAEWVAVILLGAVVLSLLGFITFSKIEENPNAEED